jgi:hypothetical protein
MIKTLTAFTLEIDDTETAVSEILEQLDLEKTLLKNSLGIISCYSEFIDTGVVEALCKKLPFNVIGGTTLANETAGEFSHMMLTLTVLTSDDVEFACSVTEGELQESVEGLDKEIASAYKKAAGALKENPKLILTFTPLFFKLAGDYLIEAFDKASGGIALFGTFAVDHTVGYGMTQTIFNGKVYKNAVVMAAMAGAVEPKFHIFSISRSKILKQQAVITEAAGNLLIKVNGVPAAEYLNSIGLSPEKIRNYNAIPFMISSDNMSEPIARGIFGTTENGSIICGGAMPVNSNLSIGNIDLAEVVATAKESMEYVLSLPQKNGLLIFSCIARNLILGMDINAEMEAVNEVLGDKIPYIFSYSGGEICPVLNNDGKLENRFHNFTIVTCQF